MMQPEELALHVPTHPNPRFCVIEISHDWPALPAKCTVGIVKQYFVLAARQRDNVVAISGTKRIEGCNNWRIIEDAKATMSLAHAPNCSKVS